MLEKQNKKLAPEPYFTAYFNLLQRAILAPRMWYRYEWKFSEEQVHDLMDAIENIPNFLYAYGGYFTKENMIEYLERYDSKWLTKASEETKFSLVECLNNYLERYENNE